MTNYNGKLIAAGNFDSAGGIAANNIASWDGSHWSNLGAGLSFSSTGPGDEHIAALAVYNGELYATGVFDSAGGVPAQNIAKWNGISWSAVGSSSYIPYGGNSLSVYNGQLYAGGVFDTVAGSLIYGIGRWNGTSWSDVGGGVRQVGLLGGVSNLATDDSLLYAGGVFDSAGNVQATNIAVWNDTAWSAVGNGLTCPHGEGIQTLSVCNGHLYAVDYFFTSLNSETDTLYEWSGTAWNAIAEETIPVYIDGGINAFYNLNGRLIVGGSFYSINGVSANGLAQWDGTNWSNFGEVGLFSNEGFNTGNFVLSMCEYNGDLYIGGTFNYIDSQSVNNIAQYTCGTTGIADIRNTENSISISPNPVSDKLYINSSMTNFSISISDMTGQTWPAVLSGNGIDVSALPAGVYCLRIQDSSGSMVRKFVKE